MANPIPADLGFPVTTRTYSWADEVHRMWGSEFYRPDVAYEMSNGRKFDSTDRYTTGIYGRGMTSVDGILLESSYPDAPAHLMQANGFKLLLEQ